MNGTHEIRLTDGNWTKSGLLLLSNYLKPSACVKHHLNPFYRIHKKFVKNLEFEMAFLLYLNIMPNLTIKKKITQGSHHPHVDWMTIKTNPTCEMVSNIFQWFNVFCYWCIIFRNYLLFYVCECFTWLYVCASYLCLVLAEVRREVRSLPGARVAEVWVAMRVLGIVHRSSGRVVVCSILSHGSCPYSLFNPETLREFKTRRIYID